MPLSISVNKDRQEKRAMAERVLNERSKETNGSPKWTVMVLMGADNLEREADLTDYAEADLQEMEAVGSKHSLLNIVVQIHRKPELGGPTRYYVRNSSEGGRQELSNLEDQVPRQTISGGAKLLQQFVSWAQAKYPADHYLLVLWGHAYRLAFNRDASDGLALDFPELSHVLQATNKRNEKLDIVGFDSCAMSMIEGAYQLRDVAKFLVAPQVTDPLPGWPYDRILETIHRDPNVGPTDLGRAIVSRFVRYYRDAGVTMTMLDLSRVGAIGDAIEALASELALTIAEDSEQLSRIQAVFQRCRVADGQPNIDLMTFCWQLRSYSGSESVRQAADSLGNLLISPIEPVVIEHGRSDFAVAMLNGVSIFAPNVDGSRRTDPALRPRYEALDLAKQTVWGELVFGLAGI
jgi:hypothetical protein